ncbi:MAG: helix-turn-helix transcriptional regulator [Candidatus Eiseniibacteriota bacterium]
MARALEHIPRLLHLVRILARAKELPIARLCEELEVTEAELRADIELLSLCGLPPYGPDNLIEIDIVGDRVRLSNRLLAPPPLQLSDEEAAGLRVALRIAEAQGWPERKALSSAIAKLEDALLPERREGARRLARRLAVEPRDRSEERFLDPVRRAIADRVTLDVEYYSDGREAMTTRRVDPYRLVALPRARYVIAWCHMRKAVLVFRLDRFLKMKRTNERFTMPDNLAVEDYVGERPRDAATMVAITVRFAPEVGRVALETYPEAKATPDGGALWKTRAWPTLAFCRQMLAWGGTAEVIEPASLREQVREYADGIARRYSD